MLQKIANDGFDINQRMSNKKNNRIMTQFGMAMHCVYLSATDKPHTLKICHYTSGTDGRFHSIFFLRLINYDLDSDCKINAISL